MAWGKVLTERCNQSLRTCTVALMAMLPWPVTSVMEAVRSSQVVSIVRTLQNMLLYYIGTEVSGTLIYAIGQNVTLFRHLFHNLDLKRLGDLDHEGDDSDDGGREPGCVGNAVRGRRGGHVHEAGAVEPIDSGFARGGGLECAAGPQAQPERISKRTCVTQRWCV